MKKLTLPPLDARNISLFVAVACIGMFIAYQGFRFLETPLKEEQKALQKSAFPLSVPSEDLKPPAAAPVSAAVTPSAEVPLPQPVFVLSGILCSGEENLALINSRVVKEGDKIEGAVVKQISEESVVLESRGKRITLRVQGY